MGHVLGGYPRLPRAPDSLEFHIFTKCFFHNLLSRAACTCTPFCFQLASGVGCRELLRRRHGRGAPLAALALLLLQRRPDACRCYAFHRSARSGVARPQGQAASRLRRASGEHHCSTVQGLRRGSRRSQGRVSGQWSTRTTTDPGRSWRTVVHEDHNSAMETFGPGGCFFRIVPVGNGEPEDRRHITKGIPSEPKQFVSVLRRLLKSVPYRNLTSPVANLTKPFSSSSVAVQCACQ